jgi:hypothetical protein
MSSEKKLNDLISNNSIKCLIILVILYFIYQNYNLVLLIVAILVVIFFNVDFKEKFLNNKYLSFIKENFSNGKIEPFKDNVMNIKDLFENIKLEIKKII